MTNINELNDKDLEQVAGGITQDEAMATALEHAQLTKDQLDFVKPIEMDYEHGRKVYEIKFYQKGFEFSYEIDADSGKILKFEKEWD